MEQDRIQGWKWSTAAQWATIKAYAIATRPVTVRVALWQRDTAPGVSFTECLDFLQKDIAKKHKPSLTRLLAGEPVTTIAPIAAPVEAPFALRNDCKLAQTSRIKCAQYILI